MKKRNCFGCFTFVGDRQFYSLCIDQSKQEGAGEYVDDSVITTKVKSQLAADDFLKSFEISVETYKGIVQLSGIRWFSAGRR